MPRPAVVGPLYRVMVEDHERLDALLLRSMADPARFDHAAFEQLRAGLLRHIGIEEKILLPDARRRRGGEPLDVAWPLRLEHAAIGMLLVPTPDHALAAELHAMLVAHHPLEEDEDALFVTCERLAGAEVDELVARVRAAPEVPVAAHFDGKGTVRTAAEARVAAGRLKRKGG